MIKRNKYKMLAAALSTSFLLSACGSVNTETGSNNINLGYDGVYAQEYVEETSVSANEEVLVGKNIHTDKRVKNETDIKKGKEKSEEPEIVLPPNMTMDDLLNMIQINGETLALPTTINKIMEFDEKFSYEAEYADENSPLYNGRQKGFYVNIFYDDVEMFSTAFPSDENDIKKVLDEDIYGIDIGKNNCKEAGVIFNLSCGIDFESSYDDVINIFGEPTEYCYDDAYKIYKFYDNLYVCELSVNGNLEENKIYRVKIKIYSNK